MKTGLRLFAAGMLLAGVLATAACDAIEVLSKINDDDDTFSSSSRSSAKPTLPPVEIRSFKPRQWLRQAGGDGANLSALHMVPGGSSHVGFAVGASGTLLRTTDGGLTWETRTVAEAAGAPIRSLSIVDARQTYIAVGPKLLVTQDGGDTWAPVADLGLPDAPDANQPINAVRFPSPARGFVLRGNRCWVTTDGAQTWKAEAVTTAGDIPTTLAVVGEDEVWVGGAGVYHRVAGGWEKQDLAIAILENRGTLTFQSSTSGWAIGDAVKPTAGKWPLYHTVDGGTTWTQSVLRDISGEPLALTNTNGGDMRLAFAPDAINGWLYANQQLYETRDGGNTWAIDKSAKAAGMNDVSAMVRLDARTGWAVSRNAGIFRYVDLGP